MSNGMNVQCSRCLTRFNIYDDIQKKSHDRVVGICPKCDNIEGYNFEHPFTFSYNAGDGEHGVGSNVAEEDLYDWEWLNFTNNQPKVDTRDYDQDDDLINNNMGWE